MTRGIRSANRLEQISLRLPVDLIDELNKLKEKEQIDRSAIIVKALRYWISVGGNVSTDNEFLNQIREMKGEINELKNLMSNPVCSPRFRASASVVVQQAAFATGGSVQFLR